jgi:hypothetical protein
MGLFDRKKIDPITVDPRNPERKAVDSFLANYVSKYGSLYEPQKEYGGKFTAGMSGLESQGLETFLPQFLNAGLSSETGDLRSFLNKTITGGFDPKTSPYYHAFRDTAEYNRKDAINKTRAEMGGRGKFFSSEALAKEGDINAQTANALNMTAADLADRERNRSAGAVGQAAGLEKYIAGIPLEKAQAATQLGSLPRLLEQNDLEALYQDFLRRQDEGKGVLNAASGVSSTPTQQSFQAYKPSAFESFVMPMLQDVGTTLITGGLNKILPGFGFGK